MLKTANVPIINVEKAFGIGQKLFSRGKCDR